MCATLFLDLLDGTQQHEWFYTHRLCFRDQDELTKLSLSSVFNADSLVEMLWHCAYIAKPLNRYDCHL